MIQELNQYTNSLIILARGISVTQATANFLYQYRGRSETNSSPFLIFLVNFSNQDFDAIEFWLRRMPGGLDLPLSLTKISPSDSLSNKRVDMYLKGGVFSISYKAIVLDLLTKRLSPAIISGFIMNNSQKVK